MLELPPSETPFAKNLFWVFGVVLSDDFSHSASDIMSTLRVQDIGTRPFFWPIHEQPVFQSMGLFVGETHPRAERLGRTRTVSGLGSGRGRFGIMTAKWRKGRSAKVAPRDARQIELLPEVEAEVPPGEIQPPAVEAQAPEVEPDVDVSPDATSNVSASTPTIDPAQAVPDQVRPVGEKLARAKDLVEGGRVQEAIALLD